MGAKKLEEYMMTLKENELDIKSNKVNTMLWDFIKLLNKHGIDIESKRANELFNQFVKIIKTV